jgi:hypothetical protein
MRNSVLGAMFACDTSMFLFVVSFFKKKSNGVFG